MSRRWYALAGLVAAAGSAVALVIADANRMPGDDVAELALMAAGAAVGAGLLGAVVLRWRRRGPLAQQALVVALTPVVAIAAGAVLAAQAMFVSQHDLAALFVVLATSGGVGAAIGLGLAQRIAAGTRELASQADRIGLTGDLGPVDGAPRELVALSEQLATTAARLDESMARERALEGSRRELVAWVSHDLRTPLAGIRAMVEALEDGLVEGDDVARYHRTLRVEADRLAGLVDDLFELSRIESSTLRLTMERVRLDEVVSEALAGAGPVARAKGVRLAGSVAEPPPMVQVAPAELSRVLRNILDNAIRHTPADGAVVVEIGTEAGTAVISVRDACGGIPIEDIDRVFDLAFRGDSARSPGGAGLGLAIARGLVEAQHGEIAVLNEADGCRFTVRLPLS